MSRLRPILPALCIAAFAAAAYGAPPAPRPFSGCGVLTLADGGEWVPERLSLYREPGILRVSEKKRDEFPRLSGSAAEPRLAATERRGGWTKVAYDDAGREGWLEPSRAFEYRSWEEFLPGRQVRLLPGMKKGFYLLRSAPADEAPAVATLSRGRDLRVVRVVEEWAQTEGAAGWFRWCDPDGRLTISLAGNGE